jgi:hypothetical protein
MDNGTFQEDLILMVHLTGTELRIGLRTTDHSQVPFFWFKVISNTTNTNDQ